MTNERKTILIIGLGLMGGSYAMALKHKGHTVNCITLSQTSIDYALSQGIIDRGTTEIDEELIHSCDIAVFALYPHVFTEWIERYGSKFKEGAVITDVTGVKGEIVEKIQSMLPEGVEFIAAHPMAGRESSGVENADDRVFKNANYIVVPTEKNTEKAIKICEWLGRELGFERIARLSVDEHDKMIAFLSQLTHCIAVSLMCASEDENLYKYTGDSFRDLTRIAKINETMWCELFSLNKVNLLAEIDAFSEQLQRLRNAIGSDDGETVKDMMRRSTLRRGYFDKERGV